MSKKLGRSVNIDGVTYEAGSEPPKEVADQITNPKAWEAGPESAETPADEDRFVGDVASDSPPKASETADKEPAEGEDSITTSTAARRVHAKKTAQAPS
jgi:hypothetical protein